MPGRKTSFGKACVITFAFFDEEWEETENKKDAQYAIFQACSFTPEKIDEVEKECLKYAEMMARDYGFSKVTLKYCRLSREGDYVTARVILER